MVMVIVDWFEVVQVQYVGGDQLFVVFGVSDCVFQVYVQCVVIGQFGKCIVQGQIGLVLLFFEQYVLVFVLVECQFCCIGQFVEQVVYFFVECVFFVCYDYEYFQWVWMCCGVVGEGYDWLVVYCVYLGQWFVLLDW